MTALAIGVIVSYVLAVLSLHFEYERLGRKPSDYSPLHRILSGLFEASVLALVVVVLV